MNTHNAKTSNAEAAQNDTLSDHALDLVVGGSGSGKATHPAPHNRHRVLLSSGTMTDGVYLG